MHGLSPEEVKRLAAEAGFDICGIAPVAAFPELNFLAEWIERGYHGEMHYLARNADRRADVRTVVPTARCVIMLGTVYNTPRPYSMAAAQRDKAGIARYAWGDDYHPVIEARMQRLIDDLRGLAGEFEHRAYVDTGPVQERVYAKYAGLGWIGKNTCLINPEQGSYFFLAGIATSLALEPDAPGVDHWLYHLRPNACVRTVARGRELWRAGS